MQEIASADLGLTISNITNAMYSFFTGLVNSAVLLQNIQMYIRRRIEQVVLRASETFPVVMLTGPRQSGKTTLLEHLRDAGRSVVSLDDLDLRRLAQNDPRLFLDQYPPPVVIDEFQYAPDLLSYIKVAVDNLTTKGRNEEAAGMYWLTGSQQFALMKGVRESLAGRVAILNLLGTDPSEAAGFAASESGNAKSSDHFFARRPDELIPWSANPAPQAIFQSIINGSMPAVITATDRSDAREFRRRFYSSYVQTYLERDVAALDGIRNLREFELFFRLLAARAGGLINYTELAKEVGVSANTIRDWTTILERSFHVVTIAPWFRSFSKRLVKTPKIYFLDSGLHAYLTGWDDADTALRGPLAGFMLENWVIGLLVRSYWHRGLDEHLSFWRTTTGHEIDVWSDNGGTITLAEIKLVSSGLHRHLGAAFRPLDSIDPHPFEFGNRLFLSLGDTVKPIAENIWQVPVQFID